ncbi:hypothetical protein FRB99_006809, partial [Tulasnella sp. 403]
MSSGFVDSLNGFFDSINQQLNQTAPRLIRRADSAAATPDPFPGPDPSEVPTNIGILV